MSDIPVRSSSYIDHLFGFILPVTIIICITGGFHLQRIGMYDLTHEKTIQNIRTGSAHFVMHVQQEPQKQKAAVIPAEVRTVDKPAANKEPIDLTVSKTPVQPDANDVVAEQRDPSTTSTANQGTGKPTRKVYGLRRVYSTGLGSGGTLGDAVVGKLGNTLAKNYDTVTATQQDIKGQIVSTTTVTRAPSIKHFVKPEYTKEMLENKIEGVVQVKVLVDIDGRVKQAMPLNDLGYNTAQMALDALLHMEFYPALRGDNPVAVWIIVPIKFVMLG